MMKVLFYLTRLIKADEKFGDDIQSSWWAKSES